MEGRTLMQMSIESVRVDGRYRKDLGDVGSLAKSIAETGLVNPITVTSDGRLIAGQRRLEACRSLGWETIPAVQVGALDEAAARLRAERDENVERKEMLVSERVALAAALEALERPNAERRQREARSRAGKIRHGTYAEDQDSASSSRELDAGQVRDVAAEAVGMSGVTYQRAGMVVRSAANADLPPAIKTIAKQAAIDMDATGNVAGNYNRVRAAIAGKEAPPTTARASRKRRPITEVARDTGWKLRKEMEKAERLIADDRFSANKEEVATHLRGHLSYVLETAQRLLNTLNTEDSK